MCLPRTWGQGAHPHLAIGPPTRGVRPANGGCVRACARLEPHSDDDEYLGRFAGRAHGVRRRLGRRRKVPHSAERLGLRFPEPSKIGSWALTGNGREHAFGVDDLSCVRTARSRGPLTINSVVAKTLARRPMAGSPKNLVGRQVCENAASASQDVRNASNPEARMVS